MYINTHGLKNGMTVILEENHKAPVISYNIVVKVGSADETDSEAGMCHLIEHMLFKGTPLRKVGEIARDIEASGGEINAYTSFDQTVFYVNMASRFSERGLNILADAVKNPLFDLRELEREKEVILEEIRRDKDNPMHYTAETLFSRAFKRHNYGRPIIGFEKTVRSFSRADVFNFYRRWYTPHNTAVIVVGDFEGKDILKRIERAFGDFKGPRPPCHPLKIKLEKAGFKLATDTKNIQATYFALGFHVPEITHQDIPAIDLLAHILAGTESSRLEQIVKEKKRLVHQIYSYAFTPKHPGLFLIGGIMKTEKTLPALNAIWKEVSKLHLEHVTEEELKSAKINIRASQTYEKETVGGEAGKLAYFLTAAGSHEYEGRYYQIMQDVQVEDIRRVAEKYLSPSKCTAVFVDPKKKEGCIKPGKIKSECRKFTETAKKKLKKPKEEYPPVEKRLPNGLRLVIRENHSLPIVSISAAAAGGLRFENRSNNGINCLIARVLTKGTKTRSAKDIAQEIESIAGRIDGSSGRNTLGITSEFLSDKSEKGFEIFGDVISNPTFLNSEVVKEKALQIEAIKNQEDALGTLALINFQKLLFKKHPYGMRLLGEPDSVKSITRGELKKYYFKITNPKNMVISVVGDVSPSEVVCFTEKYIHIPTSRIKLPPLPETEPPPEKIRSIEVKKPGKKQAHILLGFRATKIKSPDHYTMTVLNYILSGQGGRLFLELRDRLSLAYAVNSIYQPGIDPGFLAIYIGTEPKKISTAISAIKMELKKILTKPVSHDEIERAKQYLIGAYELESQRNAALASTYAFNVLCGIGVQEVHKYPEKILKVTRKNIHDSAKKYINLDAYTISIVKP